MDSAAPVSRADFPEAVRKNPEEAAVTPATRYISGQVWSSVSLEWVPVLILIFFVFPGFAVLAGIAVRNTRREEARQKTEFDSLVLSLLRFSLAAAAVDRARPWPEVAIAVSLRAGRAQYLFHRKSVVDRVTPGRRLTTYIFAYHYVRNPLFRLGGIHPDRTRTEREIHKFVFAQKWNLPVFLPASPESNG